MLKAVSFSALQTGQQVEVSPGDTLRVWVSFSYTLPKPTTVELWVSLVIPPGRDYTVKQKTETLEASTTPKEWTGFVDMPIEASGMFGILKNYTYDLWFEIPEYTGEVAIAEGAVVITGVLPGMLEMVGPLLVLGLMMGMISMVTPMMKEGFS